MSNPAIRDRVRMEMQNVLAELRASALALMKQRVRAAFFDPGKLFASGWDLLPLDELDEETRVALEVSTVQRKSGPVVRVKQPDRHRALRALEKAHEKLEQLNERYYRQLEREGRVPTLDEIEAMDQGGADVEAPEPAAEMAEEPQVLSGRELPPNGIAEKDQVLSAPQAAPAMAREDQVFSGWADAPDAMGEKHQVLSAAPEQNAEKNWVLSGAPETNAENYRVLSGGMEPVQAAPGFAGPLSSAPGPWPAGHGTLRRAGLRA